MLLNDVSPSQVVGMLVRVAGRAAPKRRSAARAGTRALTVHRFEAFEQLESRTLLAAVTWDGGGGDMLWHNPLNWAGDVLPGAQDDVVIELEPGQTILFDADSATLVRSVAINGGLEVADGILSTGLGGAWRQNGSLVISGGDVRIFGNWRLDGDLTLVAGSFTAGGHGELASIHRGMLEIQGGVFRVSGGMTREGATVISGGEVAINSQWRQFGTFTMSGGSLTGAGDLGLLGESHWMGGSILGEGKLQVRRGGSLEIDGDIVLERDIVNNGAMVWRSGDIETTGEVTIWNLPERMLSVQSSGTIRAGAGGTGAAGGTLTNYGEVHRDAGAGSTSTIELLMNNVGTVKVSEGTLDLAGDIAQRRGTVLTSGTWIISGHEHARLEIAGPGFEVMGHFMVWWPFTGRAPAEPPRVVLDGPGAQFPALEVLRTIFNGELVLSGGRAFTFMQDPSLLPSHSPEFEPHVFQASRLIIDNPGTTVIAVGISGNVEVRSGFVRFSERAYLGSLHIGDGAEVVLDGVRAQLGNVSGPGMLRIATHATWHSGTMTGGPVVVMADGTLELVARPPSPLQVGPGSGPSTSLTSIVWAPLDRVLERRLVNYGTIIWNDAHTPFRLGTELVNRGILDIQLSWKLESSGPAAILWNYGTINKSTNSVTVIDGSGSGVRFQNLGTVNIEEGRLAIDGGGQWEGTFNIAQGAGLTFSGQSGMLQNAEVAGAGDLRIENSLTWLSTSASGSGALIIGESGVLHIGGFVGTPLPAQPTIERGRIENNGSIMLGGLSPVTITLIDGAFVNNGLIQLGFFGVGMTINGDLQLGSQSVLDVGTASLTQAPIAVTGHMEFGGTLRVGFRFFTQPGQVKQIATFGSRSGSFAQIETLGLPAGMDVQFEFVNGRAQVVVV